MVDMTNTIAPKSSQLNSDDLIAGPITIKITKVARANEAEQPIAVSFEGDGGKPYMPCKSMRRVMVAVWGPDASQYTGRAMTLFRDPEVTWGGMAVGGIRISHMTHMDALVVLALTATKKARKPYRVLPLAIESPKPKGRTPREIITAFDAVKTAADYFAVIDAEGERIAKLREAKPEIFEIIDTARAAAAERMADTPTPAEVARVDEGEE